LMILLLVPYCAFPSHLLHLLIGRQMMEALIG
jgi:hypothetical protein